MSELSRVKIGFGRAGREGKLVTFALDQSIPLQRSLFASLSEGKIYDEPLARALTDSLQPGDTFIDIGSHIGYFSVLALLMVLPGGRVYAFEPNPKTFEILKANSELNDPRHFQIENIALGDVAGTADLFINAVDDGMSTLLGRAAGSAGPPTAVRVATLDELHSRYQFKNVRMVKIDVEGFEERVVRGGTGFFLSRLAESVVFEINTQVAGVPPRADYPIRRFFAEIGYQAYLIHPVSATDWVPKVFGDKQYVRLPLERKMDISYGNILVTARPMDAAEV